MQQKVVRRNRVAVGWRAPFDIEGCELGHHGKDVSLNSILKKFS